MNGAAFAADALLVLAALVGVRQVLSASPRFGAGVAQPQWEAERYWVAGVVSALLYASLAGISRFYSVQHQPEPARIPVMNLGLVALWLGFGLVTCWRYELLFAGEQLLSRWALLFAAIVIYVGTSTTHYLLAKFATGAAGVIATNGEGS